MNQDLIKKIASLAHSRYRHNYGLFLVEGIHSVAGLLNSDWDVQSFVITHEVKSTPAGERLLKVAERKNVFIHLVSNKIFEKLAATESPQGVLALARLPETDIRQFLAQKLILIADGVADPGNLGTMIRAMAAFGFTGIASTPGSADIFGPKTIRATQGTLFVTTIINHIDSGKLIKELSSTHKIYALTGHQGDDLRKVKAAPRIALVVGAEISGVSDPFIKAADFRLQIPMSGPVESLNAAVAASIAMYELGKPH
jgi:TrmH family RNA methyltransferase